MTQAPNDIKSLGHRLGLPGLEALVETRVVPILKASLGTGLKKNSGLHDMRNVGETAKSVFVFKMVAIFMALSFGLGTMLPEVHSLSASLGLPSQFITVPMMLIAGGIALYLSRNKLLSMFTDSQFRFIHRSHAMRTICEALELTFIAMPGGASETARKLAAWRLCPKGFRDVIESMDEHGGLGETVEIVRQSGLAMPSGFVIASDKNYESYYQKQFDQQQFEDGIQGQRGGVPFSAIEWHENAHNISKHHLLVVLDLPTRLSGLVEFKNTSENWPMRPRELGQDKVKLISTDFHKAFDVRAQDQMEARLIFDPAVIERITEFAQGAPVRGAAFGQHLVFDIAGHNRFDLIDLVTGHTSPSRVTKTLTDLADMLDLVDGIAKVFRVKKQLA